MARSGVITKVSPASFRTGDKLDIYVSFSARTDSFWEMSGGWSTITEIRLNGLRAIDSQWHMGWEGSRSNEKLSLGTMPARTLVGTVELRSGGEVLDRRSLTYLGETAAVIVPPPPAITPTEPAKPTPPAIMPSPAMFTCPTCGMIFYTETSFNQHLATHIIKPVVTPTPPTPTPTVVEPIPGVTPSWVVPAVIAAVALVVLAPKGKGK